MFTTCNRPEIKFCVFMFISQYKCGGLIAGIIIFFTLALYYEIHDFNRARPNMAIKTLEKAKKFNVDGKAETHNFIYLDLKMYLLTTKSQQT